MKKIYYRINDILKILFITIVLILILFSSSSYCYLLSKYYNSTEDNQEINADGKYSDIKEELSDTTCYYISPEEEEKFYENLKENYNGEVV